MSATSFQTPVDVAPFPWGINHRSSVMLLGSCFTENMGRKLELSGIPSMRNPFGILYNPLSMAIALQHCLDGRPIGEDLLVEHNGLYHSWLHHGSFSHADRQTCLDQCNEAIAQAHLFLQRCDTLVLTFGTAYLYRLKDDGRVVANCHKVPAARFEKRMATEDEIVEAWAPLIERLTRRTEGPSVRILFTVSPIRHWADGAHGNQLSKSTLLLAQQRLQQCAAQMVGYFPAYEIMMDELRDYRFYADDMLHPSPLAEEVIWERLQQSLMDAKTRELCRKYQQLERLKAHRPMFPDSAEYAKYQERLLALEQEMARIGEQ